MGWAKLDDGFASHRKLIAAGLEATGLDARAITHCARYETDGFVSDADVVMLGVGARTKVSTLCRRLVEVGRWERDDQRAGYVVHDYLVYNPSHSELESKRKADRIRKTSGRNPRWTPGGVQPESGEESEGNPGGVHPDPPGAGARRRDPVPSRPLTNSSPPQNSGVAPSAAEEEELSGPTNDPPPTLAAVAAAVAELRLARRTGPPIADRRRWLDSVAQRVMTDEADEIGMLLAVGRTPEEAAALVDPDPAEAEAAKRRTCCRSSVGGDHEWRCDQHPTRVAEAADRAEAEAARAAVGS